MCKRSCMAPFESCAERPADERPAACSCTGGPAAGTSTEQLVPVAVVSGSRATAPPEAAEKKKSKAAAADEAVVDGGGAAEPARRPASSAAGEVESARERLKRHRTEMAGRVRIPEMWGQERLLKDWVDCAVFDRPLVATRGLLNARDALVAECAAARRPAARTLRVHNGCS